VGDQHHVPADLPPALIVQEAGMASVLVWMNTEILASTAPRSSPPRVAILTKLAQPHLHD